MFENVTDVREVGRYLVETTMNVAELTGNDLDDASFNVVLQQCHEFAINTDTIFVWTDDFSKGADIFWKMDEDDEAEAIEAFLDIAKDEVDISDELAVRRYCLAIMGSLLQERYEDREDAQVFFEACARTCVSVTPFARVFVGLHDDEGNMAAVGIVLPQELLERTPSKLH